MPSALKAETTFQEDFLGPYVKDLAAVVDMEIIRSAAVKIGVDPLGGASVHYWEPIRDYYGIDLTVVNPTVDPTFRFMTLDHDGQDPHGLLQSLCHGRSGCIKKPLRPGLRQ